MTGNAERKKKSQPSYLENVQLLITLPSLDNPRGNLALCQASLRATIQLWYKALFCCFVENPQKAPGSYDQALVLLVIGAWI